MHSARITGSITLWIRASDRQAQNGACDSRYVFFRLLASVHASILALAETHFLIRTKPHMPKSFCYVLPLLVISTIVQVQSEPQVSPSLQGFTQKTRQLETALASLGQPLTSPEQLAIDAAIATGDMTSVVSGVAD